MRKEVVTQTPAPVTEYWSNLVQESNEILCPRSKIHDKADGETRVSLQASESCPSSRALGCRNTLPIPGSQQPISNVWLPSKLKFKAAFASWTHRQCSSEDCRDPYKVWSTQEGKQGTSQAPKEQAPSARVHREGAQLQRQQQSNALKATLGCWEPRPTLLLPGDLVGQLRVLWLIMRSKMTEWRPSQRGSRPHS